jgi:hypothetical protein
MWFLINKIMKYVIEIKILIKLVYKNSSLLLHENLNCINLLHDLNV